MKKLQNRKNLGIQFRWKKNQCLENFEQGLHNVVEVYILGRRTGHQCVFGDSYIDLSSSQCIQSEPTIYKYYTQFQTLLLVSTQYKGTQG